jgi:ASC-1-like (ASCH) protein
MQKVIHKLPFLEENRDTFNLIRDGKKTFETRAGSLEYFTIREGDGIDFSCGDETVLKKVKKVSHYKTLDELFTMYKPNEINPATFSIEEMKEKYLSFPGYEKRLQKYGILVFELE